MFQSFDIVEGMLAEPVLSGIAVQPVLPAGIIINGRCYFAAVGSIDDEGANGVCSIIHSYYKVILSHMALCRILLLLSDAIPVKITFNFRVFKKYFGTFWGAFVGAGDVFVKAGYVLVQAWAALGKR